MENNIAIGRRRFLSMTTLGLAAFYTVPAIAAATSTTHETTTTSNAQLKHIKAGPLDISYAEEGPANGEPVILLHGWPYDIHSFTEASTSQSISSTSWTR